MKKIGFVVFIILLIDQLSKIYIKTHFFLGEDIEVLPWFHLTFVENPGAAYGLELGGYLGKIILSLVRIGLIIWILQFLIRNYKKGASNYFIIPVSMILAGAIGNLIDGAFYSVIFDTGMVYNDDLSRWMGYDGISKLDFSSYNYPFLGCVVDMLRFPLIENATFPEWIPFFGGDEFEFFRPVFNIADSSITIAIIILFLFNKKAFKNIKFD